jgi:hypothetical protein
MNVGGHGRGGLKSRHDTTFLELVDDEASGRHCLIPDAAPIGQAAARSPPGNVVRKRNAIRHTERSTHTASLISCSRSVPTSASARTIFAARWHSPWKRDARGQREEHMELFGQESRAIDPVQLQPSSLGRFPKSRLAAEPRRALRQVDRLVATRRGLFLNAQSAFGRRRP